MTGAEIVAEARRRVPGLTAEQWLAWLQHVERLGGVITLPIGGGVPCAEYPHVDASTRHVAPAIDHALRTDEVTPHDEGQPTYAEGSAR